MAYIPDISHHDPITSWPLIKHNCSFLITKATEGTSFVDPTLYDFIKKCEANKIPYWLYTFLKKGNELQQTKFMVDQCKTKIGKYFVGYILDVERYNDAKDVKEALLWLNKQGHKTMLYTQYSQLSRYKTVIDSRGINCAWWEARYGKNTHYYNASYPPHAGVDLHQFTENGSIPGIKTMVDLNRISGDKSLEWFTTPMSNKGLSTIITTIKDKVNEVKTNTSKKTYNGTYPVLPSRGYYAKEDGINTLKDYPTQLKRLQQLLNWIDNTTADLLVDGQFGQKTEKKVITVQKILGVNVTGKFDKATLKAAKSFKK